MEELFEHLMEEWDRQQEYYVRFREQKYEIMFNLLETTGSSPYRIIDMASGPGSISMRFLRKYPGSETVMIDQDPVLLRISRENFSKISGGFRWIKGDISTGNWLDEVISGSFNAIMSTTALHWLNAEQLSSLYRHCYSVLKPGGLLMNGDHIPLSSSSHEFQSLSERVSEQYSSKGSQEDTTWESFWDHVRGIDTLSAEMAERDSTYPPGYSHSHTVTLEMHSKLLEDAGFTFIGSVWSFFSDRIIVALKK